MGAAGLELSFARLPASASETADVADVLGGIFGGRAGADGRRVEPLLSRLGLLGLESTAANGFALSLKLLLLGDSDVDELDGLKNLDTSVGTVSSSRSSLKYSSKDAFRLFFNLSPLLNMDLTGKGKLTRLSCPRSFFILVWSARTSLYRFVTCHEPSPHVVTWKL